MSFQENSQRDLVHLMENRESVSSEAFLELLDAIVRLNGCGWELGPDPLNPKQTRLSFSILGRSSQARRISEEMGLPLDQGDWSVALGIPPKRWEKYFEYRTLDDHLIEVEGRLWRYGFKMDGKKMAIQVHPPNDFHSEDTLEIAELLILGELGEENIRDFVSSISVLERHFAASQPLSKLRREFCSTFPECHFYGLLLED